MLILADDILKNAEDANEYHIHSVDREWIIKAMVEYGKALLDKKLNNVNRFEIINHADNRHQIGRLLVLHQECKEFETIELEFQDNGNTLKVFIS